MKRVQAISFVTVIGSCLLGFTVASNPAAHNQMHKLGGNLRASSEQVPARHALRMLQASAKSLVYFPAMQRVTVIASPEQQKAERDLQQSEVTLLGVGDLKIGMTLEEAATALGLSLVPIGRNLSGECAYYQPDTQAQTLGLMVVDGRVIRVDVWQGSTLATVSGVAIGASEKDVLATYPDQIEVTPNLYTQGKFLTLVPDDVELSLYRLVFETDAQGKVVQYRTGQFPAVTWPDGCI